MSERQYIFTAEELQTISCKCPKCGNFIVFHLGTSPIYGVPHVCPTCNEPLPNLARAITEYRSFCLTVASCGLPIRLHSKPVRSEDV